MEMLSSVGGDMLEFCLVVIKFCVKIYIKCIDTI